MTALRPPAAFSMVGLPTTNCPMLLTVPAASAPGSCGAGGDTLDLAVADLDHRTGEVDRGEVDVARGQLLQVRAGAFAGLDRDVDPGVAEVPLVDPDVDVRLAPELAKPSRICNFLNCCRIVLVRGTASTGTAGRDQQRGAGQGRREHAGKPHEHPSFHRPTQGDR